MNVSKPILFDAGVFIGALLKGDPRHQEARLIVETARRGRISYPYNNQYSKLSVRCINVGECPTAT